MVELFGLAIFFGTLLLMLFAARVLDKRAIRKWSKEAGYEIRSLKFSRYAFESDGTDTIPCTIWNAEVSTARGEIARGLVKTRPFGLRKKLEEEWTQVFLDGRWHTGEDIESTFAAQPQLERHRRHKRGLQLRFALYVLIAVVVIWIFGPWIALLSR